MLLGQLSTAQVQFGYRPETRAPLLLQGFELDMVRMPLGQLSTAQVQRGYEVLGRVRSALAGQSRDTLVNLSDEFYTTIPHNFKWSRPVRLCASHLGQAVRSHYGLGPYLPGCMPTVHKRCLWRCFTAAMCFAEAPFQ